MIIIDDINRVFSDIINRYGLKSIAYDSTSAAIYNSNYLMLFAYHHKEFFVAIIERTNENRLVQYYNIESFFINGVMDEQRKQIVFTYKEKGKLEIRLQLCKEVIQSKYYKIFLGDETWKEDYKNFHLALNPRDVSESEFKKNICAVMFE